MYNQRVETISYAQNQEDVLLSLALHDVEQGFYVDIGASHPEVDSVTKYFYERGWFGINVEPTQESFDRFLKERPRDTNLKVAIGSKNEITRVYLSNILGRHSLLIQNADHLGHSPGFETVEMFTLETLFNNHLNQNQIY